jgi:hypothetical protein
VLPGSGEPIWMALALYRLAPDELSPLKASSEKNLSGAMSGSGAGAIILPGVWIGDDAVIGAGSRGVTRDVRTFGNPARVRA